MGNINTILRFLRVLRIFGLFPFQWNEVKETQDSMQQRGFKTTPSVVVFKKNIFWTTFSNSIFLILAGLTIFFIYLNSKIETGFTVTYSISVYIFGCIAFGSYLSILLYISLKFKKLSVMLNKILRLVVLNSPIKLSFGFKEFSFIIYIISYS